MTADLAYIQRKFQEFNVLCFEGKLTPPSFRVSHARTFLGQVRYVRRRMDVSDSESWTVRSEDKVNDMWHYSGFVFSISNKKDLPEHELEDIILHEMIHYYILSNQMHDTSAHGTIFKQIMNDINHRFGRHITVSHRTTKEDHDNDTERRQHVLCVSQLRGGQVGVTVAARTRIFQLWNGLPKIPDVLSCRWYVTTNPFFNRFPRAKTLRIYRADREELAIHLKDARPLVRL